ncbi:hypothetical protein AX17_003666 [Amanita inopinata Kibby_2008]|nr:hypothetical protein AX17_003666 [Amanita inopinata Kibby_2008]
MAHKPTSSIDSTDSVNSSTSIESVKFYHSTFRVRNTMKVMESKYPLESLEKTAKTLIQNLAANKDLDEYEQSLNEEIIKLELHMVLKAMLEHAECGGKNAKRYVVAAICACMVSDDPVSEATLISLRHLGKTWFAQFLFIFYENQSHRTQRNTDPYAFATPTCDNMASIREIDFKNQVGDNCT